MVFFFNNLKEEIRFDHTEKLRFFSFDNYDKLIKKLITFNWNDDKDDDFVNNI